MPKQNSKNGLDELIRDHIKESGPVRDQVTVNKSNIENTVKLLVRLGSQLDSFDDKISSVEIQFNEKLADTNMSISQKIHDVSEKLTEQMTGINTKLTTQMTGINTKLTTQMTDIYAKLTEKISEKDGRAIVYNIVSIIASAFIVGAIAKYI